MCVRSEPVVEAKKQQGPHVKSVRIDRDNSQAWITDQARNRGGVVLYA